MELLPVKAGTFMYNAPKEKSPRPGLWHGRMCIKVTLTKDYHLGKFEVTQPQFEKVMGFNPSKFKGADCPVDSVTWDEAVEFCLRLSESPEERTAGRFYSLPTSAEWEYACRAGSEGVFPWGGEDETQLGGHAWCRDLYGERAVATHPVGRKTANVWGFHDMLGNVWEWSVDGAWDAPDYYGTYQRKPEGLVDPVYPYPPFKAQNKIIRGGGWTANTAPATAG